MTAKAQIKGKNRLKQLIKEVLQEYLDEKKTSMKIEPPCGVNNNTDNEASKPLGDLCINSNIDKNKLKNILSDYGHLITLGCTLAGLFIAFHAYIYPIQKDMSDLKTSVQKDMSDLKTSVQKDISDLKTSVNSQGIHLDYIRNNITDMKQDIKDIKKGLRK